MKKFLAMALCLVLALSCVGGLAEGESVYPIETDVTLRVWMASNMSYSSTYASANEHPWFQDWEKRTGIDVDWVEPAAGADKTQAYNLMIAGGDYPDLIFASDIVNNAGSHIENNVIIPLNDYLPDYAPNLWALMQSNADIEKSYKTDDGQYYCFPALKEADTSWGLVVNQKWLDECGLTAPETVDDVTNMLKTFKDKYGVTPYTMPQHAQNLFFSTYGTTGKYAWYRTKDQKVHLSAYEDGFKQALELFHSWHEDGLLDPDYASIDGDTIAAKAAAEEIGAWGGSYSYFQKINAALDGKEYTWTAVKNPVANKGDEYAYFLTNALPTGTGTGVTTACKNPEVACRFMDYLYSEEGMIFMNFGYSKGEDASSDAAYYVDENGDCRYTDLYMNGPEGMVEYARRFSPGIVGGCPGYKLAQAGRDRNSQIMRDAEDIWRNGSNEDWWCLPVLSATAEETEEFTDLNSAISTYCGEMYFKFITGEVDLEKGWDEYIDTLKGMGVEDMIAIKQAQLDRFNAR